MAKIRCFSCQREIEYKDLIGRRDECSTCRSDLHVCKNCRYFDPKVYNECRENQAEVVREKERANYCDYFEPGSELSTLSAIDAAAELKARAEALFKKK